MVPSCMRFIRSVSPSQPKFFRRWIDLSAVWFKHSKTRGNLRRCAPCCLGLLVGSRQPR